MCERQETSEYGDTFEESQDSTSERGDHFAIGHKGQMTTTRAREVAPRRVLPLWLTQGEAEMLVDLCCLAPLSGTGAERALFGKIGEMLRGFYHHGARPHGIGPREEDEGDHPSAARAPAVLAWAHGTLPLTSQNPE